VQPNFLFLLPFGADPSNTKPTNFVRNLLRHSGKPNTVARPPCLAHFLVSSSMAHVPGTHLAGDGRSDGCAAARRRRPPSGSPAGSAAHLQWGLAESLRGEALASILFPTASLQCYPQPQPLSLSLSLSLSPVTEFCLSICAHLPVSIRFLCHIYTTLNCIFALRSVRC
jgi:hypothetical protein